METGNFLMPLLGFSEFERHAECIATDGSYIYNTSAYTYSGATSSVPIAAHIATSKTDPTAATSQ